MPLPLTVICFSKIQIGFTFLVPAYLGCPGKRAVKWVFVCLFNGIEFSWQRNKADSLFGTVWCRRMVWSVWNCMLTGHVILFLCLHLSNRWAGDIMFLHCPSICAYIRLCICGSGQRHSQSLRHQVLFVKLPVCTVRVATRVWHCVVGKPQEGQVCPCWSDDTGRQRCHIQRRCRVARGQDWSHGVCGLPQASWKLPGVYC